MHKAALNALVSTGRYWVLEPKAVEWVYLIRKLAEEHDPEYIAFFADDGGPTVLLSRDKVPEDTLRKHLGIPKELDLAEVPIIRLWPMSDEDLPEPTVSYWGEA